MRAALVFIVLLSCYAYTTARRTSYRQRYEGVMRYVSKHYGLLEEYQTKLRRSKMNSMTRYMFPEKRNFRCDRSRSAQIPTSVHALKPADIQIVGALGDSLTAANGALAWTFIGCLTEYRGRSWSAGGDRSLDDGVTTLPNILRYFNPHIKGFSINKGDENSRGANFNQAVAGAVAGDVPGQAVKLVTKMRNDASVNFEEDWKLVTLFIGGNDLCDHCSDREAFSVEQYIANIREALDYLHENLPRTFVNMVEIFDIRPLGGLADGIICGLIHGAVCDCGTSLSTDEFYKVGELVEAYQRGINDLIDSGRYDVKDDFTVVLQPFFRHTSPPLKGNGDPDTSFFAPDCFHFSEKGHGLAAKNLWNNMLQNVGEKSTQWHTDSLIGCPTQERPFLATKRNSFAVDPQKNLFESDSLRS